jgi:predicted ATPase/DNA-binding NarL/FixJ family response regulator
LTEPEGVDRLLMDFKKGDKLPGQVDSTSATSIPHNLPLQLTSFVGRERELADTARLLLAKRLLTLTGAGGSGKTRLALEIASRLLKGFLGGVWFVELATLSDPELVPQVTASTLSVRETPGRTVTENLIAFLKPRHVLLVLDNCEHLVGACAHLAETLLKSCPDLRILATSREPLHLPGESIWPVQGLSLPNLRQARQNENLLRFEAIQLFTERAKAIFPTFEISKDNAAALVQVCRRLDGIPLAIELGAARVRVLSVEQIASRLDDSLKLLVESHQTGLARHQALEATLDWSHDLLSHKEQQIFRRLGVFAGGFNLEAAEAVCAGEDIKQDEVLDLLSALIDKSLVVTDKQEGKTLRYRLLEPIRQYSVKNLRSSSEQAQVIKRFQNWYLAFAQAASAKLYGPEQREWVNRIEQEYDNLRAALTYSQRDMSEIGTGLLALMFFWQMRGYLSEGCRWLETMLFQSSQAPDLLQAQALSAFAFLTFHLGDFVKARENWEQALAIYQELGDTTRIAWQLFFLSFLAQQERDNLRAISLAQRSLSLHREADYQWGIAGALFCLADAFYLQGNFSRASSLLQESAAIARDMDNRSGLGRRLVRLGQVAQAQDKLELALELVQEALVACRDGGDQWGISMALVGLAGVAIKRGEAERSVHLLGAVETRRTTISAVLWRVDQVEYKRTITQAQSALTVEEFSAAWAQGQAMSLEDAISYALHKIEPLPTAPAQPGIPSNLPDELETAGLTPRELEILRLIAAGKSNQQISEQLVLSVRTVERHISNIYKKIGVYGSTARATATAYAYSHGLVQANRI